MHFAYVIFTQLWVFIFKLTALFGHRKAVPFFNMRRRALYADLAVYTNSNSIKWAWFHCASLGEYEQAAPVIETYIKLNPSTPILLTLFSPSAHTPLTTTRIPSWKRKGDFITSLPVDTPRSVKRFLESGSYQFKFFASAKYEVWPELIKQLSKAYIPLYVFAAHVVPDSIFLKRNLIGRFLYRSWSSLSHVFTQDASSSERLRNNGIPATETGDSRADRVLQIAHSTSIPQFLQKWKGEDTVLVAGSTWKEEESALSELVWLKGAKLIIAPHDVSPANITRILNLFSASGSTPALLSEISDRTPPSTSVIIVDTMGQLSSLYALADLSVVGGGYGAGIHNILEPIAHKSAVITGPNVGRFREADILSATSALTLATTPCELSSVVNEMLQSENKSSTLSAGVEAHQWLLTQSGASEKIAKALP